MRVLLFILLLGFPLSVEAQEAIDRYVECKGLEAFEGMVIRLNWSKVYNRETLEDCISLAASTLKNIDDLESFLTSSGFNNVSSVVYNPHVTSRLGIEGDGYHVVASMPIDALPEGFGGWFGFETWWAYGLSIGSFVDAQGNPFRVNVAYLRN
ncbi:MAG: hypothetical protein JKY41_03545 [Rhodobacteraceae bacterium]|nr:hypothetical protein [Paracoccaceae bacterium]